MHFSSHALQLANRSLITTCFHLPVAQARHLDFPCASHLHSCPFLQYQKPIPRQNSVYQLGVLLICFKDPSFCCRVFISQFCDVATFCYHPLKDLTRFDYKSHGGIENFQYPALVRRPAVTYCLNLATSLP